MKLILDNALILDPGSKWNKKRADILIVNGRIESIAKKLKGKHKRIESTDLCVSPGWIDMKAHFTDPGHEYKEDLVSGLSAAKTGGFTSVVTSSGTDPVVDTKASIEYLLNKSRTSGVRLYPSACITKGGRGKELSDMIDLHDTGVRIFSDDKQSIESAALLKKALLYAKNFDGVVSNMPLEPSLGNGALHEGKTSTKIGLTGIPEMAETIILSRDIELLRYTNSRLHVSGVSTADGVRLIREAKKQGLAITAEVHLANLIWTEDKLESYDSNFKLTPPLRSKRDRKALVRGVTEGTIDCISSDHRPEDIEHKKLEFSKAANGLALIETFFPLYNRYLSKEIPMDVFLERITNGPCRILGLTPARIEQGRRAILTCFDRKTPFDQRPQFTKAYNTVCIDEELKGKVIMTIR